MTTSFDMTDSITPRSDQQNFDDYLAGDRTVTISGVRGGSAEQPVELHLTEYPGRPYKPSKSMRRVLVHAWGKDASVYVGRRLRLYGDPDVKFGGQTVGGIKIAAMSHIDKAMNISLTETRGKRKPHKVEPLSGEPPATSKPPTATAIIAAFDSLGVTVEQLETRIGSTHDKWTADDIAALAALGKALKAGTTTTFEEFDPEPNEAGTQEELA
jgi:hypothetical protein